MFLKISEITSIRLISNYLEHMSCLYVESKQVFITLSAVNDIHAFVVSFEATKLCHVEYLT